MISKSSYYSLRRENIKHRIGMMLLVLLFFFGYMIWYLISVQNICSRQGEEIGKHLTELSEPGMGFGIIVLISAVLLAVSGFRCLHSRTEIDFYYSLPVRRRLFFYITGTNDLVLFGTAVLVLMLFKCVAVAAVGHFTMTIGRNAVWSFGCYLIVFAAVYLTMALAMILTGHTFVGVLAFAALVIYSPVMLRFLYPGLATIFFKTYSEPLRGGVFDYFSPAALAVKLLSDAGPWDWKAHLLPFAALGVWVAVLLAADFILYEKRASEMAGRAVAFPKICPAVRILLVIPIALYTGMALYTASFSSFHFWIVAGIIIGGFLSHGLIECIYRFDVKGMLCCKKQMAASIVAALGIAGFFWMDLSGYDTYIPKKKDVQALFIDSGYSYTGAFWGKERKGISGEVMEEALTILADVVMQNDENAKAYASDDVDSSGYEAYTVKYRLKNGREKRREYVLSQELEDRLLGQIFGTREYKEDHYSLYTADWSRVTDVGVVDFQGSRYLHLTKEQRNRLFEIYLEELSGLTYDTAKSTLPVGRLAVSHTEKTGDDMNPESSQGIFGTYSSYSYEIEDSYYLYPTFEKTIQYIENELKTDVQTSMEEAQIKKLTVWKYTDSGKEYSITDPEFIRSIQSSLISSELLEGIGDYYYPLDNYSLDIIATAASEEGNRDLTVYTDADTVQKIKTFLDLE